MKILAVSHVDHALTPEHKDFILARFANKKVFFKETFELPPELPSLLSGLHGPLMGDPPVPDGETFLEHRGTRKGPSRLCNRPLRLTRTITVIAGPHQCVVETPYGPSIQEEPCVLYTAYGGPCAPREPWDESMNAEEKAESEAFWKEHALSR